VGCLAPLIFILLSIKYFRHSPHSGFDNNFTLIFPLAAERKTARTDLAQGRGVSGTIDIYLIVNKVFSPLTTLGFRQQCYADFSRSPLSEKTARTDPAQGRGVSGTVDIYLIVNKEVS